MRTPKTKIRPTSLDRKVARTIAHNTNPAIETANEIVTFVASEKVVYSVVAATWLLTRFGSNRRRRQGDHLLASVVASALLQRGLKEVITQQRPDRRLARRGRGIPHSGHSSDAFPSGHAMNLGVLAPVLSELWPERKPAIWTACLLVASTRIFLLAHWATDVAAGFVAGSVIEAALRPVTGSPSGRPPRNACDDAGEQDQDRA